MFQVGDQVVYGYHGVCQIVSMEDRVIDRKRVKYLVLEPVGEQKSRFLIPYENPAALSKLKSLLSREELEALLASETVRHSQWISDENARKQKYKELISGGDRGALLGMIHALHQHKKTQAELGRKFHQCDENFLNDAQKLLTAEFSLVLQIEPECVGKYILDTMEKAEGTV